MSKRLCFVLFVGVGGDCILDCILGIEFGSEFELDLENASEPILEVNSGILGMSIPPV